MARLRYGGSSGDFVINVNSGRPIAYHVVTVHTARTGGSQVTDLLDINSNPVTSVTADGYGLVAFYGPDGTHDTLWLDTGTGSRLACIAMEYAPTGAFAQTDLANTFTYNQEIEKASPILYLTTTQSERSGILAFNNLGLARWRILKDSISESGSNVGSDLVIQAYNDFGSAIGSAITITRSTRASTFGGSVIAPASTTSAASFRIPHGTAPTSPVNGDIWSTTGGMFVRINGTTASIVDSNSTQTISNKTFEDSTTFAVRTGHRNVIINGDFSQTQRGTPANPHSDGVYFADRWFSKRATSSIGGGSGVIFPGTYPGCPRNVMLISTIGTAGAGDYARVAQQIEDVRTFAGQTVTVSFWGRASTDGTKIGIEFEQFFGTGGSPSSRVTGTGQTISLTTTYTHHQISMSIPSISGKTIGSSGGSYLQLNLWLTAGSTYNTRSGTVGVQTGDFRITDVQVEEGSVATPFERVNPRENLSDCQRYYQQVGPYGAARVIAGSGQAASTTVALLSVPLPVTMRTTPTVTFSAVNDFSLNGTVNTTNMAVDGITTASVVMLTATGAAVLTPGFGMYLTNNQDTTNAAIYVSAEFTPA